MSDYKLNGRELRDRGGRRVGVLDGKYIRDAKGVKIGHTDGRVFRDPRGTKVAEFDGRWVLDPKRKRIAPIAEIRSELDHLDDASLAAMWYFLLRDE